MTYNVVLGHIDPEFVVSLYVDVTILNLHVKRVTCNA
jgi:hypothetical protein